MSDCWHHAVSSAKNWGGEPEDYIRIHQWFDEPKNHVGDFRQRMIRHHTLGIGQMLEVFGPSLTLSTGRVIPTRWVGEQHLYEDFGFQPTVQDWLECIEPRDWMLKGARRFGVSDAGQPTKGNADAQQR